MLVVNKDDEQNAASDHSCRPPSLTPYGSPLGTIQVTGLTTLVHSESGEEKNERESKGCISRDSYP